MSAPVYQAIVTKFLGPTNARGSRIKAIADAGSITISADHSCGIEARHRMAAEALREKLEWTGPAFGELIQGGMPQASGYAYCFTFQKGE